MLGPRIAISLTQSNDMSAHPSTKSPFLYLPSYLSAAGAWQCAASAWCLCLPRIWRWHGSARLPIWEAISFLLE